MSVFFFRQKTAYGMRISDWSSDVCSSDLLPLKSVYVDVRGVNVPLRRIWRSGVAQNGDRYEQVSFYVIPIQFTKQEGRLLADFTGERRGFETGRASCRERVLQSVWYSGASITVTEQEHNTDRSD